MLFGVWFFTPLLLKAQDTYAPLNKSYYHLIDRLAIKNDSTTFHSSVKPYGRQDILNLVATTKSNATFDDYNKGYLNVDSDQTDSVYLHESQKPIFKKFYRSKPHLYEVNEEAFQLRVNPVLYFSGGKDLERNENLFINSRGAEIRGLIDNKAAFYSFLTDNQLSFPSYVDNQVGLYGAIPHENFWKTFKETGYDFFTARGYINFNVTKHISTTLGYDRNFVGDGYRSLILSNYAGNYAFLKLNTTIWKFKYTNLYANLTSDILSSGGVPSSSLYPTKFLTMHHLSLDVTKNFNIGLFESIVFSRQDSLGNSLGYDFRYLNPIIFYRAVEQNVGSADNALLGLDFRWDLFQTSSLYGQFVLDEFKFDEITAGNGWWANKFALQLGAKYIDVFKINHLDLQGELNLVRPFTYAHSNTSNSYSHYNQALTHPLGANFREIIGIIRYQPHQRLFVSGKLIFAQVGRDSTGVNYGSNILKSNRTKIQTFGNTIGQGVTSDILYASFSISYMFKHNLFLDFQQIIRRETTTDINFAGNNVVSMVSLRLNIPQRLNEF